MRLMDRDFEILRMLQRLQIVATDVLAETFFSQLSLARRRLRRLVEGGLIQTHSRGYRGRTLYYRLTRYGLREVTGRFGTAEVAENYLFRAQRASVKNHEHRDALGYFYSALLGPFRGDVTEQARVAGLFQWQGENDVVFRYDKTVGATLSRRRVIPDATITFADQVVYLELDRSTERLARCRDRLNGYAAALASHDTSLRRTVLWATKSKARAANLQALDRVIGSVQSIAIKNEGAVSWLRDQIDPEQPLVVMPADGAVVAGSYPPGATLLRRLYDECIAGSPSPACLEAVYAHLRTGG